MMMINVPLGGGCLMSREGVCIWCLTKLQVMTGEVERKKSIGCNQTLTNQDYFDCKYT